MSWLSGWLGNWLGGWLGGQSETGQSLELEAALKALLDSCPGLAVLIGANNYELMLPQSPDYPCLSYYRVTTLRQPLMGADSHIARTVVSVAAWSPVNAEVKAVIEQVVACLRRYNGIVSVGAASLQILDIYLRGEADNYDPAARVFSSTLDFEVVYYEEPT